MGPGRESEQIDAVLAGVRSVLGPSVAGAYLHGSAVTGGLRPHSDLDLLVVVARSTTAGERRALVERLLAVSGRRAPRPGRPVELTLVRAHAVRPWRYPPEREFQYGEWSRTEYEDGDVPGPTKDPDLALAVTAALAAGLPLTGPPPEDLFEPPPREHVVAAMLHGVPGLLADADDDGVNVVLTLARIWRTLVLGDIVPKDEAADWVRRQLPEPHRAVLARAAEVYRGAVDHPGRLPGARRTAEHLAGCLPAPTG